MYNNLPPPPPSMPLLPIPRNMIRKKPPNMSLMKSSQWSLTSSLDAQAYPSPPMTNSPTSPKRSQFSEERIVHVHEASSTAPPALSVGPTRPPMGSQVLPPPSSVPNFMFSMPGPPLSFGDPRHDPQPRRRSQSIPPYQLGYHRPPDLLGQPGLPPPVMGSHGQLIPGAMINTSTGPVSLATVVGKIARAGTRRTKAHVARACQNCKKAHLSCDDERPCTRCVATRKEATCIDVEHKKRGRPRIQTDRGPPRQLIPQRSSPPSFSASEVAALSPGGGYVPRDAFRSLRSNQSSRRVSMPITGAGSGMHPDLTLPPAPHSARPDMTTFPHPTLADMRWPPEPLVAFLNLDLRILKTSDQFHVTFSDRGDPRGRSLDEFVDPSQHDALQHIQTDLREERSSREPSFLPGIFPSEQEQQAVVDIDENDVERITVGAADRHNTWAMVVSGGRLETFFCRIRLARTTTFFAVLTMQRMNTASPTSAGYMPRSQPVDMMPLMPIMGPTPTRDLQYAPAGPPSQFVRSAPSSPPYSSLHQMGTHPPPMPGSYGTLSPGREQLLQPGAPYFPRQQLPPPAHQQSGATMQPPPRERQQQQRRRPEPLSNVLLPPLLSTSAPTTPIGAQFAAGGNSVGPGSAGGAPGSATSAVSAASSSAYPAGGYEPGSAGHQSQPSYGSGGRAGDDSDGETSRKKRRLNIGEIIERQPQ